MSLINQLQIKADEERIDIWPNYKPYGWQVDFHNSTAQFKVVPCGRRSGKTHCAVAECLKRSWDKEGEYQFITPVWKQGKASWKKFKTFIRPNSNKMVYKIRNNDREIELNNGSEVSWASADKPDNLRSEGLDGAVFDEFRYQKETTWTTVGPALMDNEGWAVFISSPKGRRNLHYKFWLRGMGLEEKKWESFGFMKGSKEHSNPTINGVSYDLSNYERGYPSFVNPTLSIETLEQITREMTRRELFTEIFAVFLEDEGTIFNIMPETFGGSRWMNEPEKGIQYCAGVDLANRHDFTVFTVGDMTGRIVAVYRWHKAGWQNTKVKIAMLAKLWNCTVMGDSTGVGDPIVEELMNGSAEVPPINIVPYDISTNKRKCMLIDRFSLGIENGFIRYPKEDDEADRDRVISTVRQEMDDYEYRITEGGTYIYNAPEGKYDDCVISGALYNYLIYGGGQVVGLGNDDWKDSWNDII